MNDDSKRDRSPNAPKISVLEAVDLIRKLYTQARRASVRAENAAQALGYTSLHGGAATTLAGLKSYGLLERKAGLMAVSALAVRILHPVNEADKRAALTASAFSPRVFNELASSDFRLCSAEVIANHLIHQGFSPDGAKKVAEVYAENVEFLPSEDAPVLTPDEEVGETPPRSIMPEIKRPPAGTGRPLPEPTEKTNVLATFKIPTGMSTAEIIFTGEGLVPEDFDTLGEYIPIFKKSYVQRLKAQGAKQGEAAALTTTPPAAPLEKNAVTA